jgi:hypothetical protein
MDDDEAWDKIVNRRISDLNRKIESGVTGEALAELHGLHVPVHDAPPCDVDETTEIDDQKTVRDKIISRLVQIEETISRDRDLPDDVKQKWTAMLQQSYPSEPNSVTMLHDLKRELDTWQEIDPQSELSLTYVAIDAAAAMMQIYRRRSRG